MIGETSMDFRDKECHFPVDAYPSVGQSIAGAGTVEGSGVDSEARRMGSDAGRNITTENGEVDIESRD